MADHPVKVPPELAQQWLSEPYKDGTAQHIANRSAQWGADQKLEACSEWLKDDGWHSSSELLRAARRPKPPTLAEHGIEALGAVVDVLRLGFPGASMDGVHIKTLTAALNRLAELEAQQ